MLKSRNRVADNSQTNRKKMPKKGGKKKGGKKGKKKTKTVAGADAIIQKLLKGYERNCALTESQPSPWIRNALKGCLENGTVLDKFIIESSVVEKEGDMPVLLEPLLAAIRQERYIHIRDLRIWNYPMSHENTATLGLLLEKQCYPLRLVECMDCLMEPYSVMRFARSFRACDTLTTISLDYNEFGDEGCRNLSKGMEGNVTVLSISMCFCDLGPESGKYLGNIVSRTAVRDLFLDGNNLECEGAIDIIKLCAEQANFEAFQKAEKARLKAEEEALKAEQEREGRHRVHSALSGGMASGSEKEDLGGDEKKKKKKKGKKKKKKEEGPPPVGPWLRKLHLADNGIDNVAFGKEFAPIIFVRVLKKLIMGSESFEELDLEDNLIGDLSAREIVEALEHRKEEKMGGVKLKTTHKLQADTFKNICKLGAGLKKKKKKGKKKKKK
ncbi:uncharacterized protein LOC110444826 isoform X1 [Mizuhopecten yessoensis]|uniref:Uncharacterized protein n=2 Tax=Mizuhopecten yessoensis TaxID=6573 RepID=A0A210R0R1_MIZYE|nr:uncharacterized protein LOC110444826 isoform X1 [Mizuhopecten yessoensis]OWF54471.1 hypothetical protein KP79_PYT20855 [Mizuhopecten yessoensis]